MRLKIWYPLKVTHIVQGFGENKLPLYKELGLEGHTGLDMTCGDGELVHAAHEGRVVYAGEDGSTGYIVVLRSNESFQDYNGVYYFWKTIYAHLKKNIPTKVGTQVKVGDVIGYADNTGFSTGTHLHFSLKPQWEGEEDWKLENAFQDNGYRGAVDPIPYFVGQSAYAARAIPIISTLIELYKQLIEKLKKADS